MSFSIYLFAFKDNELNFRVREEVLLHMKTNENVTSYENGQFEYCFADNGRAEFILDNTEMISSIDVIIRELSPALVEYLFELLGCFNFSLFDSEGITDTKHPTLFARSKDYFSDLPLDFTPTSCVVNNSTELYDYLSLSFGAWSRYRDQIIGKKTLNDNSKTDDIRLLFNIITKSLSSELRDNLWQQIDKNIQKNSIEDSFHDVFSSMDNKKEWLWLQVDIRDYEEVQWQAVAIAKTIGLSKKYPNFKIRKNSISGSKTLDALINFDSWLSKFEKSFILIENDDTYFGFVVPDDKLEVTLNILHNVDIQGKAIRKLTFTNNVVDKKNIDIEYLTELDDLSLTQDIIILKILPNNDELKTRLLEYRNKVLSVGKTPLICLSASWCEPCQGMLEALHHEEAKSVMKQLALIVLDIDEWRFYLDNINIIPTCVPAFFHIFEDGKAGKMILDGGAWDDDSNPSVISGLLMEKIIMEITK
jgi:thiol-disulfide isomerase/thioredoxin